MKNQLSTEYSREQPSESAMNKVTCEYSRTMLGCRCMLETGSGISFWSVKDNIELVICVRSTYNLGGKWLCCYTEAKRTFSLDPLMNAIAPIKLDVTSVICSCTIMGYFTITFSGKCRLLCLPHVTVYSECYQKVLSLWKWRWGLMAIELMQDVLLGEKDNWLSCCLLAMVCIAAVSQGAQSVL